MQNAELTTSVVIATRNRAEQLRECLQSLAAQTALPSEAIIVDASDDEETADLVGAVQAHLPFPLRYVRHEQRHPGLQRNRGAELAKGDILLFVDDDIVAEPAMVEALLDVFKADQDGRVAGVGGAIVNQTYMPLSTLNRLAMRLLVGPPPGGSYAGRVVGPAINFLPEDTHDGVQRADWLNTTGTAYRRDIFLRYGFDERVRYPFDDLHLSTKIGREYQLMHTGRARYLHKDMGGLRRRDWVAFGESSLLGRRSVMVDNLEKSSWLDYSRLFLHDVCYAPLSMVLHPGDERFDHAWELFRGRIKGMVKLVTTDPAARRWALAAASAGVLLTLAVLRLVSAFIGRMRCKS